MIKETIFEIDKNFQTPAEVCDYMVSFLPYGNLKVFEPTPGLGNIVKSLEKNGYNVITPEDDFFLHKPERYDACCLNPPFSGKSAFIENKPELVDAKGMKIGYHILTECMERADFNVALMPWFTLSDSDVRMRYLKSYGLRSITPLPRKTFDYARIQTVVIVLEKGYVGKTDFITDFLKERK